MSNEQVARLRTRRNDDGFTLVEVLIVIVILGILAVIVVVAVGNTRDEAAVSVCKSDARAIAESAAAVQVHHGSYPTDAADLLTDNGGLLAAFPTNDRYVLTYTSDGSTFTITSTLDGCP